MPIPDITSGTIFYANPDQLVGSYSDGQEILSWTEGSSHAYELIPARELGGDWHMQKFRSGGVWPDAGDPSVEGRTEPVDCSNTLRDAGFFHGSTNEELLLDGPFTIAVAMKFSQFMGCFQNGVPTILTRRGKDPAPLAPDDFTGWELMLSAYPVPDDDRAVAVFHTIDPDFNTGVNLFSSDTADDILVDTPYVIVVICDGTTVKMRINGAEVASVAYSQGDEPAQGSDFFFLCSGSVPDLQPSNAPQGDLRYTRIYGRELSLCDLETLETLLGEMIGADMAPTTDACAVPPGQRFDCSSIDTEIN